jgi:hypothetical protein
VTIVRLLHWLLTGQHLAGWKSEHDARSETGMRAFNRRPSGRLEGALLTSQILAQSAGSPLAWSLRHQSVIHGASILHLHREVVKPL